MTLRWDYDTKNVIFCNFSKLNEYITLERNNSQFLIPGKSLKTKVIEKTYNPEFNEELKVVFQYPSMCEKLNIQMYDHDRVGADECIATTSLALTSISGYGDPGMDF